ncbi:MAG: hypothetical protein U9R42_11485 [Bacteroidota bacterium]|nr:hypothetical protein [Bacteroidota bacterium]
MKSFFLNKRYKTLILPLLFLIILFTNCNDDETYHNIPDVYINYEINLNLPQFNNLVHAGGYVYIDNEGYNGLLIVHYYDDTYIAIERTCTYEPLKECSVLYVDDSGIFIKCGKEEGDCCDSRFQMDGTVMHGPAKYPLRTYNLVHTGDKLTISNSF